MNKDARVFVVQRSYMKDGAGILVERFNLDPATKFGQLVDLLSPSAKPFYIPDQLVGELMVKLRNYNPDLDYVLCVGNPILIGWAIAIASHRGGGRVSCLQWHGIDREYMPVHANIPFDTPATY